MSQKESKFNDLLVHSIDDGLIRTLGLEGAKSVDFYLDPHIAIADPEIYAQSVTRLLGTATGMVLSAILDDLYRFTGIQKADQKGFGEEVADLRRKFQKR